jgi:hypothetical protein
MIITQFIEERDFSTGTDPVQQKLTLTVEGTSFEIYLIKNKLESILKNPYADQELENE